MSRGTIRVAVVGATGYGGAEIVRLLDSHPEARVTVVTSERKAGEPLSGECPWLATDLVLERFDPDALDADVVVLAQEAGFAMEHAAKLADRMRVIDLSADFRLKDYDVYEAYYRRPHTARGVEAVYGLPELVGRGVVAEARILANPGCYPTATLLGLAPFRDLLAGTPVVDAKSGVSGAGRSKRDTEFLFSELNGGMKAYGVQGHRHTPEIEMVLGAKVRFTPHLVPFARGIHSTMHLPLKQAVDPRAILRAAYADEPFVRVQDTPVSTKQVLGSNTCAIYADYDPHTGFAVVCSVIDNLVKGMAGQAIQSLNLMFGLPETTGLPRHGVWP